MLHQVPQSHSGILYWFDVDDGHTSQIIKKLARYIPLKNGIIRNRGKIVSPDVHKPLWILLMIGARVSAPSAINFIHIQGLKKVTFLTFHFNHVRDG